MCPGYYPGRVSRQSGVAWWKVAASLVLALGLFAFFLSRVRLSEVLATIGRIDLVWFSVSVALALLSYAVRAVRWGVILAPLGRARTADLLGCTAAGFATSTVLPARAGELVRPLLLAARSGLPPAGAVASILTERLLDLGTILGYFALGVALSHRVSPAATTPLRQAALLTGAGLIVACVFVIVLLRRRDRAVGALARLAPARWRSRAIAFLDHVLDGLEALRSPAGLARLLAWSAFMWVIPALQIVALARAFGVPFDVADAFVFMAVSVIGLALPTPGGVGGFHAAIQFALTRLFGVDLATATGFALLHHAVCFLPITALGLSYIGAVGFSLGRVRELAAPTAEEG